MLVVSYLTLTSQLLHRAPLTMWMEAEMHEPQTFERGQVAATGVQVFLILPLSRAPTEFHIRG